MDARSPCLPDGTHASDSRVSALHERLSRPSKPQHLELGEAGAGGERLAHPQLVPRKPVARDAQPQRHQLPRLPPGHRSRSVKLPILGCVVPRVLGGATCSRCVRTLRRQLQGRAQQSPSRRLMPRQSADQGPADAAQQPVLEAREQARLHVVQLQVQPHVRHILQQALPPAVWQNMRCKPLIWCRSAPVRRAVHRRNLMVALFHTFGRRTMLGSGR